MKSSIWIEKYRPQSLDEVVLGGRNKILFESFLKKKDIPHLLFTGAPGTGKTTVAKILIRELEAECLELNASDERGIDVIRDKVKLFLSTNLLVGSKLKVVFLDEADYLCLTEDTKVLVVNDDGSLERISIKKLCGKSFKVLSMNFNRHSKGHSGIEIDEAKGLDAGYADVYEVELEDGRKIQCSDRHPFFRKRGKKKVEEVRLRDLKVGDPLLDLADYADYEKGIFQCRICDRACKTLANLAQHVVRYHPDVSKQKYYDTYLGDPIKCPLCGNLARFSSSGFHYDRLCNFCYAKKEPWQRSTKEKLRGKASADAEYIRRKVNVAKGLQNMSAEAKRSQHRKIGKANAISVKAYYKTEQGKETLRVAGERISKTLKKRVLDGTFTPYVHNSRTHWTSIFIGDKETYKFRSSWEQELFALLWSLGYRASDIGYEKLRLLYKLGGRDKVYIVDFFVKPLRLVIEIKPKKHTKTQGSAEKNKVLQTYADNRGLTYLLLTEEDRANGWEAVRRVHSAYS